MDSLPTGPTVIGASSGFPQPLISGSKKASERVVSGPVPVYKQLMDSRFFLPGLVGLAILVLGVVVASVLMLNQTNDPLVVKTKDDEEAKDGAEDEVDDFWFIRHPLWSALIAVGTVLFVAIIIVVMSRVFKCCSSEGKVKKGPGPNGNNPDQAKGSDYSDEAGQTKDDGPVKYYAKAKKDYHEVLTQNIQSRRALCI